MKYRSSTSSAAVRRERILLCASRLYYSRVYSWFYMGMIVVNTGLLVGLGLLHLGSPVEFPTGIIALEVIVTSVLLLEVVCRICSQGRVSFFSSWCNLLDCGVVVLCLVSVILFLSLPRGNELEEAVATVLMACRYGVHFVRVLMMLKLTRKQQTLRGRRRSMDVTFDQLDQHEGESFNDDISFSVPGVLEMVAMGGFDDFDGYSERVNDVLGSEGLHKHVSQFDQLYEKHVRTNSPPKKKKKNMCEEDDGRGDLNAQGQSTGGVDDGKAVISITPYKDDPDSNDF